MSQNTPTPLYQQMRQDMTNFVYKPQVENKHKALVSHVGLCPERPSQRPTYQLCSVDNLFRAPYGVSKPFSEKNGDEAPKQTVVESSNRKTLDLSLEGHDELLGILSDLDKHNVSTAFKNRDSWKFGQTGRKIQLTEDMIEMMYKPLVKRSYDKDTGKAKDYAPTVRVKLTIGQNPGEGTKFLLATRDAATNTIEYIPTTYESIDEKGMCRLLPIVELSSIWFTGNSFGMTVECTNILIFPGESRKVEFNLGSLSFQPKRNESVNSSNNTPQNNTPQTNQSQTNQSQNNNQVPMDEVEETQEVSSNYVPND